MSFKKLKEIEDHFDSITKEELEENLIKTGLGKIKSASETGMKMVTREEIK